MIAKTFQFKLTEVKKEDIDIAAKECALDNSSFVRMAIKEKIDRMKKE